MGGFSTAVQSFLKDEGPEIATKLFGSFKSVAERSPGGKFLYDITKNNFEPLLAKTRQTLVDAANHAISTGAQTPTSIAAGELTNKARNVATQVTYGPNHELIAHGIAWAKKTNGLEYAQLLADHIAMYLQDTVHDDFRGVDVSAMKRDVANNKTYGLGYSPLAKGAQGPRNKGIDVGAVYHKRTGIENALQSYSSAVLAPLIAIPHLATPANLLFEPLGDLTKGLMQIMSPGGYKTAKQFLSDSGILNEQSLNAYRELQEYRNGAIAKVAGPKVGYIIGKAIHAPFFDVVRDWNLTYAGVVGKLSAERYARMAAAGDRLAAARLTQIGLNPSQIVQQKGILTPDQLEKAIYHAVDNRAFLSSKSERSYYSQKNPVTRLATLYHGYVTRQAAMMRKEAMLAWQYKGSNPMNFIKTFAILGVAFPAIGSVIEMLEEYGRGENGWDETKKAYGRLEGKQGAVQSIEQYLDFLFHIGGFGILTSYTRGMGRSALANTILGPIGNVASRGLTDAYQFAVKSVEDIGTNKSPSPKALMRDVLEDTLPVNLGKILTHRFLPTTRELKEQREGSKIQRLKGLKGMKRLKTIN